jgi:class 3 adenylate cyclase
MGQDEAGTLARVRALRRELINPKIAEHKGRIVKTTGDGILSGFLRVREGAPQGVPSCLIDGGETTQNTQSPRSEATFQSSALVWVGWGSVKPGGVNSATTSWM